MDTTEPIESVGPKLTICPGCKQEIDPECCWCGDGKHSNVEHRFVPFGCNCFRSQAQ